MKKIFAFGLIAILVAIDQLLKIWVRQSLDEHEIIPVITGIFNITHVENTSGALGLFRDMDAVIPLAVISGILLLVIAAALFTDKFKSNFMFWMVSIGFAGGLGNLIDRVIHRSVTDYFDFSGLFFPWVFNFADCCVVIATGLILIYIIKTDKKAAKEASETNGDNA